jgi:hypothetical protein
MNVMMVCLFLSAGACSSLAGVGFVNICEIRSGMKDTNIEGKIVDMNKFMLLMKDRTGQIFVRYWRNFRSMEDWADLKSKLEIGNNIKIANCDAVDIHGILQLKLTRKGQVNLIN